MVLIYTDCVAFDGAKNHTVELAGHLAVARYLVIVAAFPKHTPSWWFVVESTTALAFSSLIPGCEREHELFP